MKCYKCEKWGHVAKNYWYRKEKGSSSKDEGVNLAHQDSYDFEGGMVVMAAVADNHVESMI